MSAHKTDALSQSDITLMLVNFGKITKLYIALYRYKLLLFKRMWYIIFGVYQFNWHL